MNFMKARLVTVRVSRRTHKNKTGSMLDMWLAGVRSERMAPKMQTWWKASAAKALKVRLPFHHAQSEMKSRELTLA